MCSSLSKVRYALIVNMYCCMFNKLHSWCVHFTELCLSTVISSTRPG
jgi:hypothetical protein